MLSRDSQPLCLYVAQTGWDRHVSCEKNDQHLQGDGAGEGEGVRKPGEGDGPSGKGKGEETDIGVKGRDQKFKGGFSRTWAGGNILARLLV